MIFYADKIEREITTKKKQAYLDLINSDFGWGGTEFYPCFKRIIELVKDAAPGSEFDIIFLTDGCGESLEQDKKFKNRCDQMVSELKEAKKERGVRTTMYSLGFS